MTRFQAICSIVMLLGGPAVTWAQDSKGPTKEALLGKWVSTEPKDLDMTFEFNKDGKCIQHLPKDEIEYAPYAIEGDYLTLTLDQNDGTIVKRRAKITKLTVDVLELDWEGVSKDGKPVVVHWTFKRADKK